MLTMAFVILFFVVFGKLLKFALKATWGLTKLTLAFIFLPLILVAIVVCKLIIMAVPVLVFIGLLALIAGAAKKATC
jgi:TM2 domain-containing membrane protein YozV